MTNLLQQAINCDDADRVARASKGDDVVNYRFPTTWPDVLILRATLVVPPRVPRLVAMFVV